MIRFMIQTPISLALSWPESPHSVVLDKTGGLRSHRGVDKTTLNTSINSIAFGAYRKAQKNPLTGFPPAASHCKQLVKHVRSDLHAWS
ncbi:hypothetical protein CC2G_013766 [Coprinopsis cinerea AmutBmut pab1-1]|nr:hypothetical protein CC2G_013766 [Coprinopsis cinerea AmutBmut pab1-1]